MPKGGKREGAGRKPRQDGRKSRLVRVMLTDQEYEHIKAFTKPDQRREILIAAIEAGKGNG